MKSKLIMFGVAAAFLFLLFGQIASCSSNIMGGFNKDMQTISNPDSLSGKVIDDKNPMRGILNPEKGLFSETGKATLKEQQKVDDGINSFFNFVSFILFAGIVIFFYVLWKKSKNQSR